VLLLDTHVLIWAAEGESRRLGRRARALISRAESQGALRISPVSLFEIGALHTAGRIRLTRRPEQWIDEVLAVSGARIAELTPAAALEAGTIPRSALEDPLDRLLVATARDLDAALLTSDRRIVRYAAASGEVAVYDAAR
jgi:PIN domain nuclease of toxin-antitoxin system